MSKTPFAKLYAEKIASLNDQFCFFLLMREELNQELKGLSPAAGKLYSKDVFTKNSYARKIHVTIDTLPKFQNENETLTFGSYFSTSYEVTTGYIEDILSLLGKTNSSTFVLKKGKSPEEILSKSLLASGCTTTATEIIETLSYCRLRRNHFTHLGQSLTPKFNSLITTTGARLNTFWTGSLSQLDFTSTVVDKFKENETIDLIKLLRICIEELDAVISASLDANGLSEYCTRLLFGSQKVRINSVVLDERIRKVKNYIRQKFGVTVSGSQVETYAKTIGIR